MVVNDRRTKEERRTHYWAWVATDKFMSGRGLAAKGASYAAWAFDAQTDSRSVHDWLADRHDLRRLRLVDLRTYRPKCAHFSIYLWEAER